MYHFNAAKTSRGWWWELTSPDDDKYLTSGGPHPTKEDALRACKIFAVSQRINTEVLWDRAAFVKTLRLVAADFIKIADLYDANKEDVLDDGYMFQCFASTLALNELFADNTNQ